MNYPLLGIINAHNSQQAGFGFLRKKFNGFDVLLGRKDIAQVLLDLYERTNPTNFQKTWSIHEQVRYMSSLQCLEILLSQDEVLEKMNKDEIKRLYGESLAKYENKKSHFDVYSNIGLEQTLWSATRLMKKNNQLDNKRNIDAYINGGSNASEDDLDFLINELRRLSK